MSKIVKWLDGKKTYILSVAIIVYAILAAKGLVPKPDQVQDWAVLVAAYAITLRSTLSKFLDEISKSK